jgi:(S)-2-hydroxyglutarate dehydrogenase
MVQERIKCDLLIIGAGVIGLSIGIAYLHLHPGKIVRVVDKENEIGKHASGRNSGVLHAGFYYSPESLKAKFCREGNLELRRIARKYDIPIREVGKVIVARNDDENLRLDNLFERGLRNGVELELLEERQLSQFEPLANTTKRFIWSPNTAVSDPKSIIGALRKEFEHAGGVINLSTKIELVEKSNIIHETTGRYEAKLIVNAAGAQADRISRKINVGTEYAMLPFMGVYRTTSQNKLPLQRLVYPVPHPVNPFLGVHFTLTIDGLVKIGPTAIPVFGREQYAFKSGWSISDSIQTLKGATALIKGEGHNFEAIVKSEWPKVFAKNLINESIELVPSADTVRNWNTKPPGIRAQLVHLPTGKLEQDFIVKKYANSVHVLNAVSPGWTSAIPFGKWIAVEYLTD